jgi:hypothetical protein
MVVNDVNTAKAVNQKNSLLSMTLIFLQFNELLEYTKGIKESYIIGGDFNIDIHDMKVFHNLPFYYPTDPTIYIDFKTGNSQSYPGKT